MSNIIYICSLSHSGSTLSDLLLGNHSKLVSMGEIYDSIYINQGDLSGCTCGKKAKKCEVWGSTLQKIRESESKINYIDTYKDIINSVKREYGEDSIIVDSSKKLRSLEKLKMLSNQEGYDLKVLFLVKDLRNYINSQKQRGNIKEKREKDGWRSLYSASYIYNIYFWLRQNKAIKKFLNSNDIDYYQFGYEELCFQPQYIMNKICDFIDIEFESSMLIPKGGTSHIISGNGMRSDEDKLKSIKYDYRWIKESTLIEFLTLPFLKTNKEYVYSNDLGK